MFDFSKRSVLLCVGWSVLVAGSLAWNYFGQKKSMKEIMRYDATAHFNKNRSFTQWAAKQGGVYVPATETTPPNPFLAHIKDRDITTPSGVKLTLLNSAYMQRQVMRDYEKEFGIRGRFTSLAYLRPETAPDNWERSVLQRFEAGSGEITEFSELNGVPYLRMMKPLYVEEGCLKCHGHQGYKLGDLRGGFSLAIPLTKYYDELDKNVVVLLLTHLLIWGSGLWLILSAFGKRNSVIKEAV